MTAMPAAQTMTADEFAALSERTDARFLELIDGEVVVNEPTPLHNVVQGEIFWLLKTWGRNAPGRGSVWLPLDVRLDERSVYKPDVAWYREERDLEWRRGAARVVPDLAVEVRSPSTWRYDIGTKKSNYERRGVAELWLVDTKANEVLVFRRSAPDAPRFDVSLELAAGDTLESPLLPGFSARVESLFPG